MTFLRLTFAAAVALPLAAHAGLGLPLAASSQDGGPAPTAFAARAAARAPTLPSVSLRTSSGVFITEYANSAGTVFAVGWRGPFQPDLGQLLGSRYADYLGTRERAGTGVAQSLRQGQDVVVRSSGHMRAFSGVAWVPSLLPAGVDPTELQP